MTVTKRSGSKNWYMHFQLHGKTYIRSSRTSSKRIAEQMEVEWKASLHAQQFLGLKQRITLQSAIEQFCSSKAGTPNHPGLLSSFRTIARLVRTQVQLDELTGKELERFKLIRMAEGAGPQTIKHNLDLFRSAWQFAKKLGYQVNELQFPEVKLPRNSVRYLSETEEAQLLECLDPARTGRGLGKVEIEGSNTRNRMQDAYDLVIMLLDTGARYSEIANIEWSRVDLLARTINLWRSKVQNQTVLLMSDRVHEVLSLRWRTRTSPYVFSSSTGGPRGFATQSIRKALRRAGLEDCRIHTFRHTHASRLIQNGLSIYEVQEILGHSDIKTTMRYAHLERQQATAKARDVMNRLNVASTSGSKDT